ncbi:TIGR02611 family protein [Leifsonia sp. ALI-44-B]|uniref:TIGR02611 family protein n=1 Tax=Leifsonia sp. ALI-44-B TaxID=1933776 RepID=UPI001EE6F4D0|nr:TIGR02611 family protein [Leifsonia sp. ALI-44-B]
MDERQQQMSRDIAIGESPRQPLRQFLRALRAHLDKWPWARAAYRIAVALIGGTVVVVGLIMVPLPGPGWLVVFLGFAILGTEFAWAKKVAAFVKRQLARFWAWYNARRARKRAGAAA